MIERIIKNKTLIAFIVRKDFRKEGACFVTTEENPLQLGVSVYKKNVLIPVHVHKRTRRVIFKTQEILYVAKGRMRADLFLKGKPVASKILSAGDLIFLVGGSGHAFFMLADTKIIEIKQGPYINKTQDKRYIKTK